MEKVPGIIGAALEEGDRIRKSAVGEALINALDSFREELLKFQETLLKPMANPDWTNLLQKLVFPPNTAEIFEELQV